MTERFDENRRMASRHWGVGIGLILLLVGIYWLRYALLPFVIAGAVAYVATPPLEWIHRKWRWPRWLAAVVIFLLILLILALGAFWIQKVIVPQAISLSHTAPSMLRKLFEKIFHSKQINILGHHFNPNNLADAIVNSIGNWIGGPATALLGLMAGLMMFFLTLVLLAFFLISGPKLLRGVFWLVPPSIRPGVWDVAHKAHPIIYRYVGGVIIVVFVAGILCYIGAGLLLGLPDAVLVSVAVGVLEAVPVIGPILSATLLAILAVGQGKMGIIIGVALFAFSLRMFIDQLMAPIILGKAVRLHPAIIIFAFLAGGTLFGILGVLVAIPVAATIKVTLQHYYEEAATSTTRHGGSDSRKNLP